MASPSVLCPSVEVLSAFESGSLTPKGKETVQDHLNTCETCRTRFAQLSSSALQSSSHINEGTDAVSGIPEALARQQTYRIDRELGRGGMGVVYLGFDRLMERPVVVKVVNKELLKKPGATERFLREIRSAARLHHPNVMATYAAIQEGDLLAFAMEYVRGVDLADTVRSLAAKGQRMPVAHACHYIRQAALGLQHVHEKGMVHRDIKPSNLVLVRDGAKHTVKILDFGLAKTRGDKGAELAMLETRNDPSVTGAGKMLGTPDYMAPEQALDAATVDIRADVYSLGCSLYYLLTGGPPFRGKALVDVLKSHAKETAASIHEIRGDVSTELSAVVAKAMAKRPEERYQTPSELAKALLTFIRQPATELTSAPASASSPVAETPGPLQGETFPPPSNPPLSSAGSENVDPGSLGMQAAAPKSKKWMWGGLAAGVAAVGVVATFVLLSLTPEPEPRPAMLAFVDLPAGAVVAVDGEQVKLFRGGDGVSEIQLRPGDHAVEVSGAPTKFLGPKMVTLTEGQRLSVRTEFEAPARPKPVEDFVTNDRPSKQQGSPPPKKHNPFGDLQKFVGKKDGASRDNNAASKPSGPPGSFGGLGLTPPGGLGGMPPIPPRTTPAPRTTKGKRKSNSPKSTAPAKNQPATPPVVPPQVVKKTPPVRKLADSSPLIFSEPRPELLRDKYPELEFTEEKYHLVIPEFEGYENVLFLHPLSENRPASLDFSVTTQHAGALHLSVKNYPYTRSKSRGTLLRVRTRIKGRDTILKTEEIPLSDEWTKLSIPFDHQSLKIEQMALDWDCEGLFLHYEFEEKPDGASGK